jgi:hypothetical protein
MAVHRFRRFRDKALACIARGRIATEATEPTENLWQILNPGLKTQSVFLRLCKVLFSRCSRCPLWLAS